MNSRKETVSAFLKKFSRTLLATTCLTVAGAAASQAAVLTESTDLSNSVSSPTILDPSINTVIGNFSDGSPANFNFDPADYFQFTGLTPGSSFTLNWTPNGYVTLRAYDPANTSTPLIDYTSPNASTFNGTVPNSGALTVGAINSEGMGFQVSLSGVPEPGTLSVTGLALAGALALRRKKKNS